MECRGLENVSLGRAAHGGRAMRLPRKLAIGALYGTRDLVAVDAAVDLAPFRPVVAFQGEQQVVAFRGPFQFQLVQRTGDLAPLRFERYTRKAELVAEPFHVRVPLA